MYRAGTILLLFYVYVVHQPKLQTLPIAYFVCLQCRTSTNTFLFVVRIRSPNKCLRLSMSSACSDYITADGHTCTCTSYKFNSRKFHMLMTSRWCTLQVEVTRFAWCLKTTKSRTRRTPPWISRNLAKRSSQNWCVQLEWLENFKSDKSLLPCCSCMPAIHASFLCQETSTRRMCGAKLMQWYHFINLKVTSYRMFTEIWSVACAYWRQKWNPTRRCDHASSGA